MIEFEQRRNLKIPFIIKIYRKKSKKPFCEVEVPDETYLDKLNDELNKEGKYLKCWNVIILKEDFDYATIEEEI